MDDSRFTQSMLLDFYGALLTDKQRECLEMHCNDDLSLSEIAEQSGISRQGAWDNIRRADAALRDIEEKTGLVRRFERREKFLDELRVMLERLRCLTDGEALRIVGRAQEDLDRLAHEEQDDGV